MTNYQLGKIYKIVCNTTGLTYYGSTCEPTLARRLTGHRTYFKCWKNWTKKANYSSYKVLENDNFELAPSNNKMELHKRERFYIDNNECVNTRIPTRTQLEYDLLHKDRINEYQVEYRLINKDIAKIKRAEWYKNNKDRVKISVAEYQMNHKEEKKIKSAERYLRNKAKKIAESNV
jgi:hypothetical protein